MAEIRFRPIVPADDPAVSALIREVMTEYSCTADGFTIHDPEVDAMSAAYRGRGARFYVVEDRGELAGCGGFAPLEGSEPGDATCELRKMYFAATLRGRGVGSRFLTFLLDEMRDAGFSSCYLETTSWMDAARRLYERHGFTPLDAPRGRTGHSGCDRYYARPLDDTGS